MTFRRIAFALVLTLGFSVQATRPTPGALFKKAFESTFAGLSKGYAEIRMVTTSTTGVKKEQTLSFRSMRNSDNLLRFLIRFESPAELRGSAFLVREQKGALPQQYVYLPITKRVDKLTAGKLTGKFFGSDDFLNLDVSPPIQSAKKGDIEELDLGDKVVDGQKCYDIAVKINAKDSPYSKIEAYVTQDKEIGLQVLFYGTDAKLLKTMKVRKWSTDAKPHPLEIEMKSVKGSMTELYVQSLDENAKFDEKEYFESAALPNIMDAPKKK